MRIFFEFIVLYILKNLQISLNLANIVRNK